MEEEIISYSDIIRPDRSIDELISKLEMLGDQYRVLMQTLKTSSTTAASALRGVNTITESGREALARSQGQAEALKKAMAGLALDMQETNQIIAILKARTKEMTKELIANDKLANTARGSYDRLTKELEAQIKAYKALSTGQRESSQQGLDLLDSIGRLRSEIRKIDAQMAPYIKNIDMLSRAEQALAFAESEAGRQVAILKAQTAAANKESVEANKLINSATDSYDKLAGTLKVYIAEYKALSAEQRADPTLGGELASGIERITRELAVLDAIIKPAINSMSALQKAEQALAYAMSEEGQRTAVVKAEMADYNKETVRLNTVNTAAAGSYKQLKAELAQTEALYKAMSEEERTTTGEGQLLLQRITELRGQIKSLDDSMKPVIQTMSDVEKAEARLAYLQSEEGLQLLDLKNKIQELTAARKLEARLQQDLAKIQTKLAFARSQENEDLQKYSIELREANKVAKLQAQINNSAEGSYNRMAAQYELNKIELKKLSLANRELTEDEKRLVAETYTLYQEMKKIQEMTGVHTLSVGEYGKVWDSLGFSVVQVVRELPSAAFGINTLIQAVSNNIPILIDQIQQVRKENDALIKAGRSNEVTSVTKRIASAVFSWQTALIAVLTVLSMYGDEIIKWIGSLFKGEAAVMSMRKALRNLNKELENSNGSYGDNMASFKKLQNQWAALKTEAEKTEWIKNHEEAFEDLGLAINDVASAEQVLVNQADAVEETFRRRAEAAAATALATEEYEKALVANAKAEQKRKEGAEKSAKRYEKRTGKSTITKYSLNENGEYVATEMSALDYFYKGDLATQRRVKNLEAEAKAAEANAEQYLKLGMAYDDLQDDDKKGRDSEGRDLTDRIYQARLQAVKKYEESETALIKNEYEKRSWELKDKAQADIAALEEQRRKAIEWRDDPENNFKDLTAEEQQAIDDILRNTASNIINIRAKLDEDLKLLAIDQQISQLKIQEETNSLMQQAVKKGSDEEYKLRKESIERQLQLALLENKKLKGTGNYIDPANINAAYNQQQTDLDNEWAIQKLEHDKEVIELSLQLKREGSAQEIFLQKQLMAKELELALEKNRQLAENLRLDEQAIKDSYARREKLFEGQRMLAGFSEDKAKKRAQYIADNKAGNKGVKSKQLNDYYLDIYGQEQEIAFLEDQITLAEQGFLDWSPEQIAEAKANLVTFKRELDETKDIWNLMGEKGVGGGILTKLGFDDDQIDAFMEATNIVISQIQAIAQAEVEAAEKAVEAAQERADAAKSAYDAEIEARNNGYANNVATAKAELEQEKKKQKEKQKMLEAAQKTQARIDSAMQMSSLVTATANLWASYSKLGPLGQALTIAAIAAMWGSFGAAKLKAKNVTSQEYGEGGLEFLEGGSHASGNDIDLGTVNSRGRRMRAEGGEAMAIINKKNTRKYKALLPGIVDSLNAGNFEDKYLSSLNTSGISLSVNNASIDISKIEDDVADIRKQNETKYYTADGYLIIQRKNVKRIIKN